MASKVYFTNLRTHNRISLPEKLKRLIKTAGIGDIDFDRKIMIDEEASIYDAYTYMVQSGFTGAPVVKKNKKFVGYVSLKYKKGWVEKLLLKFGK